MLWVKGHQDIRKSFSKLKWEEKLNIRADFLATKAKHKISTLERNKAFECLPACLVHLVINGKPITSKIITSIRNAWCEIDLRKHCKSKFARGEEISTQCTGKHLAEYLGTVITSANDSSPIPHSTDCQ
eukprot:4000596-Ditylum_brightwellii.AAC.1